MTPKIANFLSTCRPSTPCLVLDVDRVEENFHTLQTALPNAQIYYAVKANPAQQILQRLVRLNSRFDAASIEEIKSCIVAGADPCDISFGNTIKKPKAIRAAYETGVKMFAFDSAEELMKIVKYAPKSKVYCRIIVKNSGAEWPLSRKFGTTVETARELMLLAAKHGLDPYGISFHVGSQQTTTHAYEIAISQVAMLFTDLLRSGLNLRMINLGGGFPTRYRKDVLGIDQFANSINTAIRTHFGNTSPEIIVEPGRFLVADAGLVNSEVILVCHRDKDDPVRWIYLDIGRFGGLAETEGESIKYQITTSHDGNDTGPVILAGPTCDSADILYEKSRYQLPLALASGEQVQLRATGAYVASYASQCFNGFAPLTEHYI